MVAFRTVGRHPRTGVRTRRRGRPPGSTDGPGARGQALMQVLPNAGFRAPITLTVFPQMLIGMWIGI